MKHIISFYTLLIFTLYSFGQKQPKTGIYIKEFGKTYPIEQPDFKTDIKNELKVVFDVGRSFKDSTKINPLLNTAARYLNMHVAAGVPVTNLKVAIVIHGNAANDILNDIHYKAKYSIDNPNKLLIKALSEKKVQIILCGQTAAYRAIKKEDTLPEIQFALSAMTALVQLQNENYRLINF